MSEWVILGCCIGVLTVSIAGLIKIWRFMDEQNIEDLLMNTLISASQNEEAQKAAYTLGSLVGSAMLQGTQLKKTGGKMNLESIIGQIIANFVQQRMGGISPEIVPVQPQQPQNTRRVPPAA